MRINPTALSLRFPLSQVNDLKETIASEFNLWGMSCSHLGSWRALHENNFPEAEIENILRLFSTKKEINKSDIEKLSDDVFNITNSLNENRVTRSVPKNIIYAIIIEPFTDEICRTLDGLASNEQTKPKAEIFASWIYTYAISRLGLIKADTKLEKELEKRFNKIDIAPKAKHCCQGLCSACGRSKIVFSCSELKV